MTPLLAATLAAAAVVVAVRPRASRRVLAGQRPGHAGTDPLAALGHAIRRRLLPAGDQAGDGAARRTGAAVVGAVVLLPVAPQVLLGVLAWTWGRPRLRALQWRRRSAAEVTDLLPDLIDLLRLTTDAGLPLPLALPTVAARTGGSLGDALRGAEQQVRAGRPRADALLEALTPLGDGSTSLGHAIADHLRYGAPLGPALDRLAFEARVSRRHRAEQAARRVPVRLLMPLVLCVLPAFGLLTVVPLLAGSLRSLAG
jgi:tight adherence protein C